MIRKGGYKVSELKISPMGTRWEDFEKDVFTPEEIIESNLKVDIINKIIQSQDRPSQTGSKGVVKTALFLFPQRHT